MGAAEMKAGHTEEYVDGTSAAPWPQLDWVRPKTSPALVDDVRRSEEDGEGRGVAKYNTYSKVLFLLFTLKACKFVCGLSDVLIKLLYCIVLNISKTFGDRGIKIAYGE